VYVCMSGIYANIRQKIDKKSIGVIGYSHRISYMCEMSADNMLDVSFPSL